MYKLIKNYQNDDKLRDSLNKLAEKTFKLNFENWYKSGYWRNNYIPYSIVNDNEIIANVSVNIMDMKWEGGIKHFIQLGTVMTEKQYRNQGFIRRIMDEIEADFAGKTDGMYLFANDSVLGFYPKFGYYKAVEFQYSKTVDIAENRTIKQIPMRDKQAWEVMESAIQNSNYCPELSMCCNVDLYMFYVTDFMQENVYYDDMGDVCVIAETEGEELFIHAIFSAHPISLDKIIYSFGNEIKKVTLGFTPEDISGYNCQELHEKGITLFLKGNTFDTFGERRIMFPTLSHA